MTPTAEIRRRRLQQLVDQTFNTVIADFARAAGIEPTYAWQIINGPPSGRNLGEKSARKIEEKLRRAGVNLTQRWLDEDASTERAPVMAGPLSSEELNLLRGFRAASDDAKARLLAAANTPPPPQIGSRRNQ